MTFKYQDLMSNVLPEARPWGGWPDGMEPWAAAEGECKEEKTCNDHTGQCEPSCGGTGVCPTQTNVCPRCTSPGDDKKESRRAVDFGLLQEQLRQTLALGL